VDRLKQRLLIAHRALDTFDAVLAEQKSPVVRDAAIQRFEYTFEAVWKCAQLYLKQVEGVEAASPKNVIRSFFQTRSLHEDQARLAMAMADDRNLTVHTYNEALAEAIYARLPEYARLLRVWLASMEPPASPPDAL
jgi:nucleotidyltransferase substrate binding protein (TIGR01987 family)